MKHIEEIGTVCSTYDYGMFKQLEGNRGVLNIRKKKVRRSVDAVGYINIPIIVNDKYEIIDGAARYEIAVERGLPIVYTIVPNIGLKECVAINTASTNWGVPDYIKSYAESGNDSYIRLYKLTERYGKLVPFLAIWNATTEMLTVDNSLIKEGRFYLPNDIYLRAIDTLDFSSKFKPIFDRLGGRKEFYYSCLNYLYSHNVVDMERLERKIIERQANLYPVITLDQAFIAIEEAYNNCARTKAYLLTNYKMYMDSKYAWYRKRYMNDAEPKQKAK